MSTRPDMIQAMAQYIAKDFAQKGHPHVEVYAEAYASLNGRRSQQFIDPTMNLVSPQAFTNPGSWILPLKEAPIHSMSMGDSRRYETEME